MTTSQYERPLGFWLLCVLTFFLIILWEMALTFDQQLPENSIISFGILLLYVTNVVILGYPRFTAEEGKPFPIFFAYFISSSLVLYSVLYKRLSFSLYYYPVDVIGPLGAMLCGCALFAWTVAGLMTVREDHWISKLKPYRLAKQLVNRPVDPLSCVLLDDPKFTAPVYYFPPPPPSPLPTYNTVNPQIIY